jgi:hypothetical protein
MNEEELNRLYELLDASYTANCMLIGNELAGSNEKICFVFFICHWRIFSCSKYSSFGKK